MFFRGSLPGTERRAPAGGKENGAVTVEFALIFPVLILIVFGIVDFAYGINRNTMVNNASRDGARMASLGGTYTEIRDTVANDLKKQGVSSSPLTDPNVTITISSCTDVAATSCTSGPTGYASGSGKTAVVKVEFKYKWITPVTRSIFGSTLNLKQSTEMRIE